MDNNNNNSLESSMVRWSNNPSLCHDDTYCTIVAATRLSLSLTLSLIFSATSPSTPQLTGQGVMLGPVLDAGSHAIQTVTTQPVVPRAVIVMVRSPAMSISDAVKARRMLGE